MPMVLRAALVLFSLGAASGLNLAPTRAQGDAQVVHDGEARTEIQRHRVFVAERMKHVDEGVSGSNKYTMHRFRSNNKLFCGQGDARSVEAARALKRAGVQGALYNPARQGSTVLYNTTEGAKPGSCTALGYVLSGGEDQCYPGVQTFFRNEQERQAFVASEVDAVEAYRKDEGLTRHTAWLMARCSCHPKSLFRQRHPDVACEMGLKDAIGSWVHSSVVTGNDLICDEGPIQHSTFALATLKSSAQLPMHVWDQISTKSCKERGFVEMNPSIDHCFPKMHMWTRKPFEEDPGVEESKDLENSLFYEGGFTEYCQNLGLNEDVLSTIPGCHCLDDSQVYADLDLVATCQSVNDHPGIRDWWKM